MAKQRNPKFYIYKGGSNIPRHVTHIRVHKSIKVIQEWQFFRFDKLECIELHDGVEAIGCNAFNNCTSLKHVRALGVKVVERCTFFGCRHWWMWNLVTSWNESGKMHLNAAL